MIRRVALWVLVLGVAAVTAWGIFRLVASRRNRLFQSAGDLAQVATNHSSASWDAAVEKVRGNRDADPGGGLEIPPELKHYEERYWFLATQVAEIEKHKIHICQDYMDLAAMLERGELVPLPAVTDTYILYGVGQRANEEPFEEYSDQPEGSRPELLAHYQSLYNLAKNFNGRSFDLNNPADRYALKVNMLSSIRPQALKIIEEVAAVYKQRFDRPLPVSSMVRPEQYQRALRRVNRNAVTIDTPPHSTGLAFDIDYRYMSIAEQNFVMNELARIKNEGRIEVIRERNANYHVFAFMRGARPSDELVSASLEKAGAPPPEAHHTEAKPAKITRKAVKAKRPRAANRTTRRRRR